MTTGYVLADVATKVAYFSLTGIHLCLDALMTALHP